MKRTLNKIKQIALHIYNNIKQQLSFIHMPAFLRRILESEGYKNTITFLNKYSVFLHIPLSMSICFILEWMSRHSFVSALSFVTGHTLAYLYNSYVIYVVFSLCFLIRRQTFLRMVISVVFVILGIINCVILLNRVTPFGFTDLYMIGDLLTMQNTQYFSRFQASLLLASLVVYAILMIILFIFGKKQDLRYKFWMRLIFVAVIIGSFLPVTSLLRSSGVLASYFGNLAQGYKDYGYIYGFTTSIYGRGMEKPFGYSETNIKRILSETDMGPGITNDKEGPNVIVVLLESFFDISEVDFIKTDKDPIPFFHQLENNYSTGYCTVPVVGAGTCNSEFEVLTGMSCQFFGPGEYPQKTIIKETDCESYAGVLSDIGYGTHVVHNNGGNFYSRANAFSMMGFDSFTCKEVLDISEWTPLNTWPRDSVLIDATIDALDSTEGSDFVYTITVETHGDYAKEDILNYTYADVECDGKDEELSNQWKYYIQMLHNEDMFIRNYIETLSERDEDTIVIMFGDHLPTMGLESDELKSGNIFKTKYVTWNNFEMEKEDKDLTSYQLVAEYLNRLNIHGGTILNYNQSMLEANVRPGSFSYMNNLEQLQYDLLYGSRYAYDGEDKYPATDLLIGNREVIVDRVYPFGGRLHIYGENFTPWSYVYVNGERVSTTYESGQCLSISLSSIKNGSPLFVGQVGSNETLFRQSNQIHYINPQSYNN